MTIRTLPAVLAIATIAATGSFAVTGATAAPAGKPPAATTQQTKAHYNNWRGPVRVVCYRAFNGRWWVRKCIPQYRNFAWNHPQRYWYNNNKSYNNKSWNRNIPHNYPSRNYW